MKLKEYFIERVYMQTQTLGSWYGPDGKELICKTMELPWSNNASNISCVPEDTYLLHKMPPKSDRAYWYFRFMKVEGRSVNKEFNMSSILVHRITYVKDLAGCVGVGGRFSDLNKDGVPDMADSGKKLQWMVENLPDQFLLTIKKKK